MNTLPNPCDNCRHQVQMNWQRRPFNEPRQIYLSGSIQGYEHNLKIYLKDCCLYAYHIGSQGFSMALHDRQAIIDKIKIKVPKYVCVDGRLLQVYELIPKREDVVSVPYKRSLKIARYYVKINKSNLPYEFLTKSEFNKRMIARERDVIMAPAHSTEIGAIPCQYVYLIRERTAVVANQPIYKLGKTTQPNFDRFKGYHKGYEILLHIRCDDCHLIERAMIEYFINNYRHATEYGNEYFEGDYRKMMKDIFRIAMAV